MNFLLFVVALHQHNKISPPHVLYTNDLWQGHFSVFNIKKVSSQNDIICCPLTQRGPHLPPCGIVISSNDVIIQPNH